jgi:hypothetical protein
MITVKKLKKILNELPDDAQCSAYEGEDVGINVRWKDKEIQSSEYLFIRCRDTEEED